MLPREASYQSFPGILHTVGDSAATPGSLLASRGVQCKILSGDIMQSCLSSLGMQCTEYLCPRNLPTIIKHKGERSGQRLRAAPSVAAKGHELRVIFLPLRLRK